LFAKSVQPAVSQDFVTDIGGLIFVVIKVGGDKNVGLGSHGGKILFGVIAGGGKRTSSSTGSRRGSGSSGMVGYR